MSHTVLEEIACVNHILDRLQSVTVTDIATLCIQYVGYLGSIPFKFPFDCPLAGEDGPPGLCCGDDDNNMDISTVPSYLSKLLLEQASDVCKVPLLNLAKQIHHIDSNLSQVDASVLYVYVHWVECASYLHTFALSDAVKFVLKSANFVVKHFQTVNRKTLCFQEYSRRFGKNREED